MQRNGPFQLLLILCLAGVVALLSLITYQIAQMEERLIRRDNQFREMANSADRLRSEVQRLAGQLQSGALTAVTRTEAESAATPAAGAATGQTRLLLEPHDHVMTLPDADMDGVLRRYYGSDPKGFNIFIENAADLQELIWSYVGTQLGDRMGWTDPDRFYGLAAEQIEVSSDYQEFTVRLKKGILWHKPGNLDLNDPKYAWLREDRYLTAHDVKFSIDLTMNPQVENGFMKNYYEDLDVENCEVVDDHTIIIRWKRPYYGAIEATVGLYVLPEFFYACDETGERFPEETLGLRFNNHWYNNKGLIGTGPYRLVSYKPGEEIRLARNEDYYGPAPAIREIIMPIYADPNLSLVKLKAHELTISGLRPSQYQEEIKQYEDNPAKSPPSGSPFFDGRIDHQKYIGMVYYYIGWNMDKPIFSDARARTAMSMALNRKDIIDNVFQGLGQPATGPNYIKSPYNDPSIPPIPFDLEGARALLKEAGWEDTNGDGLLDKDLNPDDGDNRRQPFEFTFLIYGTSPEWASVANIYRNDLLRIGVKMDIEAAEWALMQKKMDDKEFDAFSGGWGLTWDPDPFQLWHSSQADIPKGSNRVGLRNAEADEIIETLRRTFDAEERIRLLHRFHQILHREQPYTFFYVPEFVVCNWQELQRLELSLVRPHAYSLPWWIDTGMISAAGN